MTSGFSDSPRHVVQTTHQFLAVSMISFLPEPSTPGNESSDLCSSSSACVRGSLIHVSKSEVGKLMWLPLSSTTTSCLTEDMESPGCVSVTTDGENSDLVNFLPGCNSESPVTRLESADLLCYEDPETSEVGPVSPTLTVYCGRNGERNHETSENRIRIPQSSERSESSLHYYSHVENAAKNKRFTSFHKGLTPYLSSKLKPGKHVLGVKRNQAFIRPGQLRHWAVGKSPALASSFAGLPSPSNKGNACRTLNF